MNARRLKKAQDKLRRIAAKKIYKNDVLDLEHELNIISTGAFPPHTILDIDEALADWNDKADRLQKRQEDEEKAHLADQAFHPDIARNINSFFMHEHVPRHLRFLPEAARPKIGPPFTPNQHGQFQPYPLERSLTKRKKISITPNTSWSTAVKKPKKK